MAKERLDAELVEEFVNAAHVDLNRVNELLESHPSLINAAWDWGEGDWETGLGGAAHMGRRDIALVLLDSGARLDVFAAAMLGYIEFVRSAITDRPDVIDVLGPHGIPLLSHAEAGGDHAAEVLAFLKEHAAAG